MVLADAARDNPRKPHSACTAGNEQTIQLNCLSDQANTGQCQKTVLAPQVRERHSEEG